MDPATALPEELTEEVFLRIHPAAAATLVRAAAVCKRWRRLIADAGFHRRFRAFHGTPPMLGFSCNIPTDRRHSSDSFYGGPSAAARFVRTSAASCLERRVDLEISRAVDARHGRVLLHVSPEWYTKCLLVWDPITKEEHRLPEFSYRDIIISWNAAVFCAGAGCDHLDCHGKPFAVVFVATGAAVMFNLVYSSETGWGSKEEVTCPCDDDVHLVLEPSALVGNALYFVLETKTRILKYNISTREMHMVHLPPACCCPERRIVLMATEDGGLGFATMRESKLYLWSREGGSDKDARWAQRRVIDLEPLLPVRALVTPPDVVGFAQGVGLVFVMTKSGHFRIDLKSSWVKKVHTVSGASTIFPYMSFHTPALGATADFTGEGSSLGASTASSEADL